MIVLLDVVTFARFLMVMASCRSLHRCYPEPVLRPGRWCSMTASTRRPATRTTLPALRSLLLALFSATASSRTPSARTAVLRWPAMSGPPRSTTLTTTRPTSRTLLSCRRSVAPPSGDPRVRDAGTQCDPPLEVLRPCMLVDLSDLVARLAALEKETPDNHALAARCAASLLPKIKPIMLEVTELAVDQAISASTASIEKVLTPLLERVCALEAAPPAAPNETPARAPAPVAPSSTDGPLPRPARPEDLSIGACVLLDDLKSAELNGATGTVVSLAGTNGRYGVAVPGLDAPKAFKMPNLFVFDTSASTCSSSAPAERAASRGDSLPPRPARTSRSSRTSRPARSQAATRTSNTRPPSRSEWEAMCAAIDWQP